MTVAFKSRLKWTLLCVLVYLIFLLVKLPAAQVLYRFSLPAEISLTGVSGTLWKGQAEQLIVYGLPLNKVSWQLDALPLLWGSVKAVVKGGNMRTVDEVSFKGAIELAKNSLGAKDVQAYLPTNLIISLLPLPFPVNADGRFRVQLETFAYNDGCEELKGQGQWLNAKVAGLQGPIALGNFAAQLGCDDRDVVLEVKEPNRFGLSAIVRVPKNRTFTVQGKFKPEPSLPREVQQAAQFFGTPDGEGYYPLRL